MDQLNTEDILKIAEETEETTPGGKLAFLIGTILGQMKLIINEINRIEERQEELISKHNFLFEKTKEMRDTITPKLDNGE